MFFEGSEKKLELVVKPHMASLRSLGHDFWQQMVTAANAQILSHINNDTCDAYLLSESSLFVWDERFLMLTCGTTTLIESALLFIETHTAQVVDFICYQRKNEYQSQLQKTSLNEDLRRLRAVVPMRAFQLGYLDSHHHYLAHMDSFYQAAINDHTCELLMYHIQGAAADYLRSANQSAEGVRAVLQLAKLLPDFILDDFVFTPYGYSVNAIRGRDYATIHITPEQNSSYVSLETNLDLSGQHRYLVDTLLHILTPLSWDIVGFNCPPNLINRLQREGSIEHCNIDLSCGYNVQFCHQRATTAASLPVIAL